MKTRYIILALTTLCLFSISFTSCRGSASKKAATEAMEFLEKRGASKGASTIEREAAQAERNAARETESYNTGRSSTYKARRSHYDGDESSYQNQTYAIQCSQCGGGGVVYLLDYYGNIQLDYYGNPVIRQCPNCGGTGSVIVTQ